MKHEKSKIRDAARRAHNSAHTPFFGITDDGDVIFFGDDKEAIRWARENGGAAYVIEPDCGDTAWEPGEIHEIPYHPREPHTEYPEISIREAV